MQLALSYFMEVKMIKLKHKKLTKIGGSKGFIIDAPYIKNGVVSEDKEYSLIIIPKEEDENNENKKSCISKDRHKSNVLSSSNGTNQNANLKSPTTPAKSDSNGASPNPVIHQCPMYRNKPLSKGEAEIQLKKKGVIKNGRIR